MSQNVFAQSTVIYQDDFEGSVSGWSVNNTDYDPDVTNFLGRFDNSPKSTSRIFSVPTGTDSVVIAFDFYRFDSWDNSAQYGYDRFEVDVDGIEIFSLIFYNPEAARSGTTGNVDWSHSPSTPTVELAFGVGTYWFDQIHRVEITVNNPGATLDLTLRADLNQGGNDESAGFDNMIITAHSAAPVLPSIVASKTVDVVAGAYTLPGALVEYTLSLENSGGPVDSETLVFIDDLPDNVTLFTGDLDGSGNSVHFTYISAIASGVTCCTSLNIAFSNSISDPPVFGYVPISDYDSAVRYLRITPSGTLRDSQTDPVNLNFKFRASIN